MIEKYFTPGQKMELHSTRRRTINGQERPKKIYVTQVNQILSEEKIEVLMPIEQSKLVLLPQNAIYNMITYTSNGLFSCEGKVADRYKSGNVYIQVMEVTSKMKRYQRREYYRHDCSLPMTSRRLEDNEKDTLIWNEHLLGKEGTAIDIGGGGLRFLTEENYQVGELVVCMFKLAFPSGEREVQALGKVLSTKEVTQGNEMKEIRVQFESISHAAREQIIQFIFEEERKKRKKNSWR